VRVPAEAGLGNAKVTLSFPAWKEGNVATSRLELPVIAAPKAVGGSGKSATQK
jgi:hypothetical protein